MKRIIKRVRRHHIKEVVIYGMVGLTALVTQMSIYLFLTSPKIHMKISITPLLTDPVIATIIGNVVGMLVSYYGHTRFTFQKTHHFSHEEFVKFVITALIGLAVSTSGIYILVTLLKFNHYFGLLPMIISPGITFLISKFWAFR